MSAQLEMWTVGDLPLFKPGDDLVAAVVEGVARSGRPLRDDDILVIAQKVVSKVEGRLVRLSDVVPGARALELGRDTQKDPRLVELILSESARVMRHRPGVLVVEQRLGLVMANAGIDASNVSGDDDTVLLLPEDPDATCIAIRSAIQERTRARIAVVINDSVGRAWRLGTVGLAIGAAGLPSLLDLRGNRDIFGRVLRVSEEAVADEVSAAASLLQGQGSEATPVVVIRGLKFDAPPNGAAALVRPKQEDLF